MYTYKVLKKAIRLDITIALGFIAGVVILIYVILRGEEPKEAVIFLLVWMLSAIYFVYKQFKKPTTIELSTDRGKIRFFNRFFSKEYNISSIKLIDNSGQNLSFEFSEGTIEIANQINQLHDLISKLVAENGNIKTVGC